MTERPPAPAYDPHEMKPCPVRHDVPGSRLGAAHTVALADPDITPAMSPSLWSILKCAKPGTATTLRAVTLHEVLQIQPDWTRRDANLVLAEMGRYLGIKPDRNGWTLGWVLDSRSAGTRIWALLTATTRELETVRGPRWPFDT